MAAPVLTSCDSHEGIQQLGNAWTLTQAGKVLRCALTTHPLGWALAVRRDDSGSGSPIRVCRTEDEVFIISAEWYAPAKTAGWED
jgi:hypothetical protein